jgi:hypothetical protein
MKVNYDIRVEISQEELGILKNAESIISEICQAYSNADQCELCPMKKYCDEKGPLDNQLCHTIQSIYVNDDIEEQEYKPEPIYLGVEE